MTDRGAELARYARAKIREELRGPKAEVPEGCDALGAAFVTLRWRDGRLQGCIGTLEARRSLVEDVAHNALAAAVLDPRAEPIELDDVDELDVELSVLSPLERVPFVDEASARAGIERGTHGVVLAWGARRATYLPSMWDHFETVEELMASLKEKAGLPSDFWRTDMKVWRYTVDKHVDPAPAGAKHEP
jgi:AmmeMemoRadiSam system protein A